MPDQFPVFERLLKKRGRVWRWCLCTTEGKVVMHGTESSRTTAKYKADRALFLMLLCAPYQSTRLTAQATTVQAGPVPLADSSRLWEVAGLENVHRPAVLAAFPHGSASFCTAQARGEPDRACRGRHRADRKAQNAPTISETQAMPNPKSIML